MKFDKHEITTDDISELSFCRPCYTLATRTTREGEHKSLSARVNLVDCSLIFEVAVAGCEPTRHHHFFSAVCVFNKL